MTASDEADAPEPSEVARDEPLMISQRMRGRGTDQTGTWVAAGAIDDEGTARITQIQSTDQDDGTLLIEATHLLVSNADEEQMIELRSETILQPFPPPPPQHCVLVERTIEADLRDEAVRQPPCPWEAVRDGY